MKQLHFSWFSHSLKGIQKGKDNAGRRRISLIKKVFSLLLCCTVLGFAAHAQVKVKDGSVSGSSVIPNSNAIMELESNNKGLLLPRVELTATNSPAPLKAFFAGMTVYNTATAGTVPYGVTPGYYYSDGNQWISVKNGGNSWFYVPASLINTTVANGKTFSIYDSCVASFTPTTSATGGAVASASAPAFSIIQPVLAATDFYYYVLGYSPDVFANLSVDANGLLTYDVIGEATDDTYINIVMMKK